jgi:hypothetical protein
MSETKDRGDAEVVPGRRRPGKDRLVRGVRQRRAGRQRRHGTGSLAASSFLNFGKDDTNRPSAATLSSSSRAAAGEHVGFVDSVDKAGNVKVLGGNTGDKVGDATYSKSQVLAIRRPPTPSESRPPTTRPPATRRSSAGAGHVRQRKRER